MPLSIDIKAIFKDKDPKMAKRIPGFVYRWIERSLCIPQMNEMLRKHGHLKGLAFADAVIKELNITLNFVHEERLPAPDKRYMFVSNHPLGGLDGIAYISMLGRHYGENIRVIVNDILMKVENLNSLFLPVNSFGAQNRHVAQEIEEVYASDVQMLSFPAGACSRPQKGGIIADFEWMKSFILKARQTHRDIVPMHFIGQNSRRFNRIYRWRRFFHLDLNIEMLRLPKEVFNKRNATFTVIVGEPIPIASLTTDKSPKAWAQTIRQTVYDLNR